MTKVKDSISEQKLDLVHNWVHMYVTVYFYSLILSFVSKYCQIKSEIEHKKYNNCRYDLVKVRHGLYFRRQKGTPGEMRRAFPPVR